MVWSILKHQALIQNICCVYFLLSQEVNGQYPEELSESGFIGRKCVDRGRKNPAQKLCYFQLLMWATAINGVDVDKLQKTHLPPSYRAGVTASSDQSGDLYRTIWSQIKCCLVSGSISRWQQLNKVTWVARSLYCCCLTGGSCCGFTMQTGATASRWCDQHHNERVVYNFWKD